MSARAVRRALARACAFVLTAVAAIGSCLAAGGPRSVGRIESADIRGAGRDAEAVVMVLADPAADGALLDPLVARLAAARTRVAIIDAPALWRRLAADDEACSYPAADAERFAHWMQAEAGLPAYQLPVLVGIGRPGALAYALLAQAPAGTFAGAVSLDYGPALPRTPALCAANALRTAATADGALALRAVELPEPWALLCTMDDDACRHAGDGLANARAARLDAGDAARRAAAVAAAARSIAASATRQRAAPATGTLDDLPLVEQPAPRGVDDRLVVLLTGDGGWAGLDRDLASELVGRGVPVVALDSLRYFWTARDPDALGRDLARIASHYLSAWGRSRLLLVGYSQGADVLPFAAARLPPALRARIDGITLLAPGEKASFAFHVSQWLGADSGGLPVVPEIRRLGGLPVTCVRGAEESDSACEAASPGLRRIVVPGGHHFDGDYANLARIVAGG